MVHSGAESGVDNPHFGRDRDFGCKALYYQALTVGNLKPQDYMIYWITGRQSPPVLESSATGVLRLGAAGGEKRYRQRKHEKAN
jgi:hypothetical protein